MPDGTDFIGHGIIPYIEFNQTVKAFREGKDPVLERAIIELNK